LPVSLNALLGARLDRLDVEARDVLERGAVEGELFHRGAVVDLSEGPSRASVPGRLEALTGMDMIRPDAAGFAGEVAFRFKHILVRDATYLATAKKLRASLHERFAQWLERLVGERGDAYDEILGYHLEQACRYRAELGLAADVELAAAARARLTAAGRRATLRADFWASVNLLERAVALAPSTEIELALELDLVQAMYWAGRAEEAFQRAGSLAERAWAAGDRVAELCARLEEGVLRTNLEPEGAKEKLAALVERAVPEFEAAGDDLALYWLYFAAGQVANMRSRMDVKLEAFERAAAHAERAGLPYQLLELRANALLLGTTSVSELLAWLHEHDPRDRPNLWFRALRAAALAMLGRFDEARGILAETRAELADRGDKRALAAMSGFLSVDVELLCGDPAAAVELGAEGCKLFEELGEKGLLSSTVANVAQALCALDRLEEAEAWAGRAADLGASDDVLTQMLWRQAQSKVLARRGEHATAEPLAREAVAIGEGTDMLNLQGDTYADLAEVLEHSGKGTEAVKALKRAAELYARKGNVVSAQRTQARITELNPAAPR
jgi:hypothetical protein